MKTVLAVVGVTAALALSATVPAHADVVTTVSLAARHSPTTAAGFGAQDCAGLGARRGVDTWRFTQAGDRFDFASVTARFAPRRDARTATFVARAPGPRGTAAGDRATLSAPAGLWLIGASATVRGKGKKPTQFTLSRTCAAPVVARPVRENVANPPASPPAETYPSEYPAESPAATAEPEPSESWVAPPTDDPTEEASGSPSTETETLATRGGSSDSGLPVAALAVIGLLIACGLAISVGFLLAAIAHRRRRAAAQPAEGF